MNQGDVDSILHFARSNPHVNLVPVRLNGVKVDLVNALSQWDPTVWTYILEAAKKATYKTLPMRMMDVDLLSPLRLMGCSEDLRVQAVLGLLARHEMGGMTFLRALLTEEASIASISLQDAACVWEHFVVPLMKQNAAWQPSVMQALVVECTNENFFRFFRATVGLEEDAYMESAIFSVGNVPALKWMRDMGFDLWKRGRFVTPIHGARSRSVVAFLLDEAGADLPLLFSPKWLAPPRVLRWVAEINPTGFRSAVKTAVILFEGVDRNGSLRSKISLEYIKLLRDYDIVIPRGEILAVRNEQMLCALITYGYRRQMPANTICLAPNWVAWTHWTHRHFRHDAAISQRVWYALLCLKRACPALPRDLRLRNIMELALEGCRLETETLLIPSTKK